MADDGEIAHSSADQMRDPQLASLSDFERNGTAGRGGNSVVYFARHLGTGDEVALKIPKTSNPEDAAENVAALLNELDILEELADLNHPNIVPILYKSEHDAEEPFIAVPILGKIETLDRPELVRALHGIASALDAVHGKGIAYKDLKFVNINFMVDADGRGVLTDFGAAQRTGDAGLLEQDVHRFARAATYMVMQRPIEEIPELAQGFSEHTSDRSRSATEFMDRLTPLFFAAYADEPRQN